MLLKTWQKWKNYTLAEQEFNSKSPGQRTVEATTWEFSIEEYLAINNNKSKTLNLSTLISVRTWWESPTRREKNCSRSLAESSFVILKCNTDLSFFLINLYFHTFNWHLQVLMIQKEIQYQCPHSNLFPDFGLVFIIFSFEKLILIKLMVRRWVCSP